MRAVAGRWVKRAALALAGFVTLAAMPAWADGTLGLDEVLTAVANAPKLVAEIRAELDSINLKPRAGDLHRRAPWQSLGISRRQPCCAVSMRDRPALPQDRGRPGLFRRARKAGRRSRKQSETSEELPGKQFSLDLDAMSRNAPLFTSPSPPAFVFGPG